MVPTSAASIGRTDPTSAPRLARVFCAHAAIVLGGVTVLVMTPLTVTWPPNAHEAVELGLWTVALLLSNYLVLRYLFSRPPASAPRAPARAGSLTARELEIVRLTADGYTRREIAEMLVISPKTVDAHRAHILKKLGLRDRVALTRYAIRNGLVNP